MRTAEVKRKTKETDVFVSLNLDQSGEIVIDTGVGFFDHMLTHLAFHGGFSLTVKCKGDLEIDAHHTVEDCALAIGEALKNALGDKKDIARYGFFVLPMDEVLAQVAIDVSGRPVLVFEGNMPFEYVGQFPSEMGKHFFKSLADTAALTINIKLTGENTHHILEGCFKAFGRALGLAVAKTGQGIPSTKGVL